ncbi:histidyl-tRNA synthetase [Bartonella callosciuri]|uniref:Histidyl-tRNA synthetase n=1 Tax=Bartonella callosciuri TaxID=686223 RepID=A0A840NXF6_9HYPH|nr:histidyl-tRNA synthetase [Bartonella callosciuri]
MISYAGRVFEGELLFGIFNDDGQKVVFGSFCGGGCYDKLVACFCVENVLATVFFI